MTLVDALGSGIDRLVLWRRRQRKRREGRWDWWDDEWRREGALTTGIRYTDSELLEMMRGPSSPPPMSYNEAVRAMELFRASSATISSTNPELEAPDGPR